MTERLCNAGRNYFYISHKGEICRCTCRNHNLGEVIGHIKSFDGIPHIDFRCSRMEECESHYLGDWNRSSRFDTANMYNRGEFSVDPVKELATKLNLTGVCNFTCHYCHPERLGAKRSEEQPPEVWLKFLTKLKKHYSFCHHYIQGTIGEPTIYNGIERIVKHILDLGDKVTVISNFSRPDIIEKIIEVIDGRNTQIGFGASLHPTDPKFKENEFFEGVKKVVDVGPYIEILFVSCPTHIYLDEYWKSKCDKLRVPFRRFFASMQPETAKTKETWSKLHSSSISQTTVYGEKND